MNWKTRIRNSRYTRLAVIAGTVVLIDQITKAMIMASLPLYHTISVIPGFFNLTLILNPGGAFGFLAGEESTLRHVFFLGAASAAMCFIVILYRRIPPTQRLLAAPLH
jgi:signal peptidase II